jgi:hypothetical protein
MIILVTPWRYKSADREESAGRNRKTMPRI